MTDFSVAGARGAAEAGALGEWVDAYLRSPRGGNDPPFADGLARAPRWWHGPVEMRLCDLERICGPEPHLEYPTDPAAWESSIAEMAASLDLDRLPPLITMYHDGALSLRDGSHRHEALRRAGVDRWWVLVWCNDEDDHRDVLARWPA